MKNKQELCLIYSPLSSIISLIGKPNESSKSSCYKNNFKNTEKNQIVVTLE